MDFDSRLHLKLSPHKFGWSRLTYPALQPIFSSFVQFGGILRESGADRGSDGKLGRKEKRWRGEGARENGREGKQPGFFLPSSFLHTQTKVGCTDQVSGCLSSVRRGALLIQSVPRWCSGSDLAGTRLTSAVSLYWVPVGVSSPRLGTTNCKMDPQR